MFSPPSVKTLVWAAIVAYVIVALSVPKAAREAGTLPAFF